jgi:predicted TIM-barrel fold metal-dependent hydrolase
VAASHARVVNLVENYMSGCSAEDREAVLGGNAANFWRLKP